MLSENRPGDALGDAEWLQRLARGLVRDANDADDLFQDTWVAALENRPVLPDQHSRRSWLARVARNLVARRLRDRAIRSDHERNWAQNAAGGQGNRLPADEATRERLRNLVAVL
jgi:DNA-directed RNA polymerase specialized sigma24 family protein